MTKFNSKGYSISFFPANSIQKFIQNFEIGCIQFNKIFIQLRNVGIDQGYFTLNTWRQAAGRAGWPVSTALSKMSIWRITCMKGPRSSLEISVLRHSRVRQPETWEGTLQCHSPFHNGQTPVLICLKVSPFIFHPGCIILAHFSPALTGHLVNRCSLATCKMKILLGQSRSQCRELSFPAVPI